MDTHHDGQAGMQLHPIINEHHQRQHTPDNVSKDKNKSSSSDTSCDETATGSGAATSSIASNSIYRSGQGAVDCVSNNRALGAASGSEHHYSALQSETPISASTLLSSKASQSQSSLTLHQFTHHPLQHYHHQRQQQQQQQQNHSHNDATLVDDKTDSLASHACTSSRIPSSTNGILTSSIPQTVFPLTHLCEGPKEYCKGLRRLNKSPSLDQSPIYFASDPSSHSINHSIVDEPSSSSAAAVHSDDEDNPFESGDRESFPGLDCSNGDARDPRTSTGRLTEVSVPEGVRQEEEEEASDRLDIVPKTESEDGSALKDHDAVQHTNRDQIVMAQLDASGIIRPLLTPAQVIDALPSSPSFASYCISTMSARKRQGNTEQSFSASNTSTAPQFISPNALLHRRLMTSSQKTTSKRNKWLPSKDEIEHHIFSAPLKERRRSSLGCDLSPSSSTRVQKSVVPSSSSVTFQLQPVPISKRKRARKSSAARRKDLEADPPRMEKRIRMEAIAGQTSASSRQFHGLLTSISRPADSLHESTQVAHWNSLNSRRQEQSKKPHVSLAGLNTPSQPRSRASRPRLSRTQSLPNLKAMPEVDLSLTVTHRLALPSRLIDYLSSLRIRANAQHPQQHQYSMATSDMVATTPLMNRDRTTGNATSAQASSFARNGYCSTSVDSSGNIKSIFIPSLHPPITRQTLKELDLHEILKNPQLRHDIVFDANVQFRPNFDGERGRKKKEFGNKYWYAIQKEIETGCTCTSFNGKILLPCSCGMDNGKTVTSQLAGSLSSIKSPMPSLANYSHSGIGFHELNTARNEAGISMTSALGSAKLKSPHSAITWGTNRIPSRIPLLIQELRAICLSVLPSPTSSMDPITPATAKVNTSIASMSSKAISPLSAARTPLTAFPSPSPSVATHHILIAQALDPLLITQQLQHGLLDIASLMSFLGSILKLHCAPMRDEIIETMIKTVCVDGEIGLGLRMCFEILELMKLDTANHQLRSSRMYLIETAVDFEIRWYKEQLDQRKVNLERTRQWFTIALQEQSVAADSPTLSTRTKMISKSFDIGLLRLIMDLPLDLGAPSATTNFSTASLKHAYINNYPETFQFDAYRLISFHGDVTDITIVYMLLLLFRQLACSSSNLAQASLPDTNLSACAIQENASKIATRQLNSVKNEIWTLLNDADQEIIAIGMCPTLSSADKITPKTPTTHGRLLIQSAFSGSHKLENPVWRKAMNDVVLQIAARAIEVQIQARRETKSSQQQPVSPASIPPPREVTMKMLMSWIETNLRRESPLRKLCQQRLKGVLYALLDDDQQGKQRSNTLTRKDREESSGSIEGANRTKRIRLQARSSIQTSQREETSPPPSPSIKSDFEIAIQKGGLEPFVAEIKLLSERIIKVRNFHLRVFRSLYERIAGETLQEEVA